MIPVGNKKLYYSLSGGITTFNPRLIKEYPLSGIGCVDGMHMCGDWSAWMCVGWNACGGLVARVDASPYGDDLMCSRGLSAAIPTGR